MTDLKVRIEELVVKNLNKEDLFLVDVLVSGSQGGTKKITVLIDGDKGVSVEDCAELSRKLGIELETENLIDTAYILEVSSPGIDLPLKLKRQYKKNVGRKLSVLLNDQETKTGKLAEVNENSIVLEEELKEKGAGIKGKKVNTTVVEIPFDQIMKSNVLIAFN